MTKNEIIKLALEAWDNPSGMKELCVAMDALRAALEQPEQEPVAGCACRWNEEGDRTVTCERHQGWLEVIAEWADRAREAEAKLKAAAPAAQRPWVGLTDEERNSLWRNNAPTPLMKAIEDKLKARNT